jgi:hypothetical protein
MQQQCIVLHESISRREVDHAAYKRRWGFSEAIAGSDDIVRQVIYETKKTKSQIHYILEKVRDLPYLIIEGEAIEAAIQGAQAVLPVYSHDEIIRMVQSPKSDEEYIKGILYLGLEGKFKECDVETLDLFKQALQSKYSETRTNAIIAMSYAGWPEFRDLVHPFSKNDPDDRVRETAARFLEGSELP